MPRDQGKVLNNNYNDYNMLPDVSMIYGIDMSIVDSCLGNMTSNATRSPPLGMNKIYFHIIIIIRSIACMHAFCNCILIITSNYKNTIARLQYLV